MMDWFTVFAQIVNFLILVALLKHFLYGPIIRAMDEREATVVGRLRDADAKRQAADEKAHEYEQRKSDLEARSEKLMTEARRKAESESKRLVGEARRRAEEMQARWQKDLDREHDAFLRELRTSIGRGAVSVATRALRDMANADLQQQMAAAFTEQLKTLSDEDRQSLARAIQEDNATPVLRSHSELEPETVKRIQQAVSDQVAAVKDLQVETAEDLVCGIELVVNGYKAAWSIGRYLEQAAEQVEHVLSGGMPKEGERDGTRGNSD